MTPTTIPTPVAQRSKARKWIKWDGGDCPVPKGTILDCKYRDGTIAKGLVAQHFGGNLTVAGKTPDASYAAHYAYWHSDGMHNDIIAYRVQS